MRSREGEELAGGGWMGIGRGGGRGKMDEAGGRRKEKRRRSGAR